MKVDPKTVVIQVGGMFLAIGLVMFVAAGTIAWPAGWVFLLLFFAFTVAIALWLMKNNPELLTERMTGMGKAEKGWDKVFLWVANLTFIAWIILMPLDAVRFQWSQMPNWLQVVGVLMLLTSFSFAASISTIFGALLNGATALPFDLQQQGLTRLTPWLIREEITIYHSTASGFRHFAKTLAGDESFPSLRLVKLGGEAIYRQDIELFK